MSREQLVEKVRRMIDEKMVPHMGVSHSAEQDERVLDELARDLVAVVDAAHAPTDDDREALARLIDPEAWRDSEPASDAFLGDPVAQKTYEGFFWQAVAERRAPSFAAADRVIAGFHRTVQGEAHAPTEDERMAAQAYADAEYPESKLAAENEAFADVAERAFLAGVRFRRPEQGTPTDDEREAEARRIWPIDREYSEAQTRAVFSVKELDAYCASAFKRGARWAAGFSRTVQGEPAAALERVRLYCENQGDKFRYHAQRILDMLPDTPTVQGEAAEGGNR
ncbi:MULTISPECIES: hypothetical protein [Bacteria]|uniref:hypothetical protein n=1 Tax=Bacteria TaxID=2 RepID=UPI003C79F212